MLLRVSKEDFGEKKSLSQYVIINDYRFEFFNSEQYLCNHSDLNNNIFYFSQPISQLLTKKSAERMSIFSIFNLFNPGIVQISQLLLFGQMYNGMSISFYVYTMENGTIYDACSVTKIHLR